nr:hypothetical protein [Pedobacter sp. ASV19]
MKLSQSLLQKRGKKNRSVSGQASPTPSLAYGKLNDAKIRPVFAAQLFNPFTGFWLYITPGFTGLC